MHVDLTIVVSVFDEERVLPLFIERARQLLDELPLTVECILVNDGSRDRSAAIAAEAASADPRFRLVSFSRNFGHEAAMIAGIDHARGDAVVCMDADLQHPFAEIPRMWDAFAAGDDVVTMARERGAQPSFVKRLLSKAFYRVLNAISPDGFDPDASDFFLVSRRVADVLRADYRERVRFLRGLIQVIGFPKTSLRFAANPRASGESKYPLRKLLRLSAHALFSFSNLPLRLGVGLGVAIGGLGLVIAAYSIVMKWLGSLPSGYTTIVVLLCLLFAVQFVITGIIGEYVGLVFSEVKRRPLYVLEQAPRAAIRPLRAVDEGAAAEARDAR